MTEKFSYKDLIMQLKIRVDELSQNNIELNNRVLRLEKYIRTMIDKQQQPMMSPSGSYMTMGGNQHTLTPTSGPVDITGILNQGRGAFK